MTSTEPAESVGASAVIVLGESTLTSVAGVDPKATAADGPTNPVPVMVTAVPPVSDPLPGLMAVTTGDVSRATAGATESTEYKPKSSNAVTRTASTPSRGVVTARPRLPLPSKPRSPVHRCPTLHECSPLECPLTALPLGFVYPPERVATQVRRGMESPLRDHATPGARAIDCTDDLRDSSSNRAVWQ